MAGSYLYTCDNEYCPISAVIPEQMPINAPDPMAGWISTRRRCVTVTTPMSFFTAAGTADEVKSFCSLACLTVWAQDQKEITSGK